MRQKLDRFIVQYMDIHRFPNPKLNLPKELRDSPDKGRAMTFASIENYLDLVDEYIYTDINLDYERSDPRHIHAWIQRIISANLLRSLYLRNAFVDAFNARNTVGIFPSLRAWYETVGALSAILDMLENNLSADQLFEQLQPYAIGNKGKGKLRIGEIDAVNVMTMIEKADKYISKMRQASPSGKEVVQADTFFTDYYDVASNLSHPCFDSLELVGNLTDEGVWRTKEPDEVREGIIEILPGYGGLLMTPLSIKDISKKIFEIENGHFSELGSRKFFE